MNKIRKTQKAKRGLLNNDPFFLGKYYLKNILFFTLASGVVLYSNELFKTVSPWWVLCLIPLFLNRFRFIAGGSILLAVITLYSFWSGISWVYLLFLPIAIYIGHLSAVFIHNAVHNNFKPLWLNPIVGWVCALQQVSAGAPVFKYIHSAHHVYPDDPEKDPHPPQGYTFWEYVDVSRSLIGNWLARQYLQKWGDSEKSRKMWEIQNKLLLCSRFAKTFFLFSLLGPKIFVLLYLPSYLSNVFLFAAFNYFSHPEKEDGTTEILNLDSNLYFKVCNKILFGIMYHKNHHLRPILFNPMEMKALNSSSKTAQNAV